MRTLTSFTVATEDGGGVQPKGPGTGDRPNLGRHLALTLGGHHHLRTLHRVLLSPSVLPTRFDKPCRFFELETLKLSSSVCVR